MCARAGPNLKNDLNYDIGGNNESDSDDEFELEQERYRYREIKPIIKKLQLFKS